MKNKVHKYYKKYLMDGFKFVLPILVIIMFFMLFSQDKKLNQKEFLRESAKINQAVETSKVNNLNDGQLSNDETKVIIELVNKYMKENEKNLTQFNKEMKEDKPELKESLSEEQIQSIREYLSK